jgi:CheY-like chemotaxis protein
MPKTLLLADDSVTIQKVVGISFANEDVRIVTVDNGDDAVTRAREVRPDIVLADVVMPGKSGYEVCGALKGDPELAHIPVLLLTGTFETFDEARAAQVGADGHITKPFEAQALVELVTSRLARRAAPAPAGASVRPAAEPEPFDFLEPETAPASTGSTAPARPAPSAREDAFAFEEEPLETIDLEAEAQAELDLGNDATAARTTLLLDEDDAYASTHSELPVPAERVSTPPAETAPPAVAAELDEASDVTRLVLPAADEAPLDDAGVGPSDGDPLSGLTPLAAESFEAAPPHPDWDVASSELLEAGSDPSFAEHETMSEALPSGGALAAPRAPLFDDDAAAEFELAEPPAPAPGAAVPAPEWSGEMREHVHTTIEKIAWEALGDVSDRIVREAVARIEQVAWDVIPRLAETLIREEIRKLKGEE